MGRGDSIDKSYLDYMLLDENAEPEAMPLSLLKEITDDFSHELIIGKGGFAVVYKGKLTIGFVAVKRLSKAHLYVDQYLREIKCLMKVKHKNIVRFLGYCSDTQGKLKAHEGDLVMADTEQRLLCFEYLPGKSLDHHITDPSEGLEWSVRYKIIKGICEGLQYLHQNKILHLDLKPGNILLDSNFVPKITDFGLARLIKEDKTHLTVSKVGGTSGYLAPEHTSGKVVTDKFDLYSLGVLIIEILMGVKGHQHVQNVLANWSSRLMISEGNAQWKQIKECVKIGIQCIESDPEKRPSSMKEVIDRLVATESAELNVADNPSKLLGVHPFALCFRFEPNKLIPCSLHLTNNTDVPVAFRLMKSEVSWPSLAMLPLYGIVPPRSPYNLIVIARKEEELPEKEIDLILEATRLGDEHTQIFKMQPNGRYFEMAKLRGNVVQEVTLRAICLPRRDVETSYKASWPRIKIMYYTGELYTQCLYSLDTNQEKQWIILGEDKGHVRIWNYQTQRKVYSIKVSKERVNTVKFIARKQWFVTGTNDGYIHVYSYENKMQKIASIKVESGLHVSLAIHPTRPYLLSSGHRQIKLWNWDKGWACIRTFEDMHPGKISEVAFSHNGTIARASEDRNVKVWCLCFPKSHYILFGHSNKVNCLHFFTCIDQEYLVTGSNDHTAKIWDMQKRTCVCTIKAFLSPVMSAVYHTNLQTIITGSKDGLIYLWSFPDSRLERIIDIGCHGAVRDLSCLMRGVAIGKEDALATMDIEQSMDYYSMTRSGDTNCKVVLGSKTEVAILDVHPRELHFLMGCKEPVASSLHLTNKTDEPVVFRLNYPTGHNDWQYLAKLPQYDIVPPRSTYTLVVKTKEHMKLEEAKDLDIVLQSTISGDKYIVPFEDETAYDDFFGEAKQLGHAVHEVSVKAFYRRDVLPQEETTSEIISNNGPISVRCLDAHPRAPWIVIGYSDGTFGIWMYDSQGRQMDTFKVSETSINSIKFIARKQWIVAGTSDGFIHVYSWASPTYMQKLLNKTDMRKITRFRAHNGVLRSLAVNPIHPFVLSASRDSECKLWDMDKGWQCIISDRRRLVDTVSTKTIAFNQQNPIDFAFTTYSDSTIKVWRIDDKTIWGQRSTLLGNRYSLLGHDKNVNCLDFFTRDDVQYLISGSNDCTAKIWDLQKRKCIHTLEALGSPAISVISFPDGPYLITGTEHGIVHVWSSINFRLKRTINIGSHGLILSLACLKVSRRVVIGHRSTVLIMNIDEEADAREGVSVMCTDEEEAVANEDNSENSVIAVSTSRPPILDVHPLELNFLRGSKEPITCSLDLTNEIDERVAFRLIDKTGNYHLVELPLYGIVPPRSTYTLIVRTKELMELEEATDHDLVLQSSIYTGTSVSISAFDNLFGEARELGPAVHEVSLKVVYDTPSVSPPGETSSEPVPVILPRMKVRIISNNSTVSLCCIDAHPTKPLIITGHYDGTISLWRPGQLIQSLKVSEESAVIFVKIIARNETAVAVTADGLFFIYYYSSEALWIKTSRDLLPTFFVKSLVVHPEQPYMLLSTSTHIYSLYGDTVCDDKTIMFRRKLEASRSTQVAFNPQDSNIFASAGNDRRVQVWSIYDSQPSYTLSGHLYSVNCLDFFTRHDGQYLITGSDDCTAKIWDLKIKKCIHTMKLETIMSPVVSVIALPDGPFLITGTGHGIVHVWSSTDFRLHRTINVGGGGPVRGLACLKGSGSGRVVIGQEKALSIMDIDIEQTNANSGLYACISWLPSVVCSIIRNSWGR